MKKRPVLIVSNNANNKTAKTITVAPITSNVNKIYPFEVKIEMKGSTLPKPSKVQCHQIRTLSKIRIKGSKAGFLSDNKMSKVNDAIKLHLDIS